MSPISFSIVGFTGHITYLEVMIELPTKVEPRRKDPQGNGSLYYHGCAF